MSDFLMEAPPMSRAKIEDLCWALRQILELTDPYLPIVYLLEFGGLDAIGSHYYFHVADKAEMGNRHGAVDPINRILMLREDVYFGAVGGKGRDRFTAAHEFGHAVLHTATLNRAPAGVDSLPAYRDPEWQANEFAGAFLMPRRMMMHMRSLKEVTDEFGVTFEAASTRARRLKLSLPPLSL